MERVNESVSMDSRCLAVPLGHLAVIRLQHFRDQCLVDRLKEFHGLALAPPRTGIDKNHPGAEPGVFESEDLE